MTVAPLPTPLPQPDPRYDRRYPIHLTLQYHLQKTPVVTWTGSGRTLNISTHGLLFESEGPMLGRGKITLELAWPCLLDGVHRLKVVIHGTIVRREGRKTAVKFETYEFRTRGRSRRIG